MLQTFKIPAVFIDAFEEKLLKLNKKAKKIGAKEIEYKKIGATVFDREKDLDVPSIMIELNQEDELKNRGVCV